MNVVPSSPDGRSDFQMPVCFFFFLRFYLFIHERPTPTERAREREKQTPCREPDVGLDARTPGLHPGLKVALNC